MIRYKLISRKQQRKRNQLLLHWRIKLRTVDKSFCFGQTWIGPGSNPSVHFRTVLSDIFKDAPIPHVLSRSDNVTEDWSQGTNNFNLGKSSSESVETIQSTLLLSTVFRDGYPYGNGLSLLNRFRTICISVGSLSSAFDFWQSTIARVANGRVYTAVHTKATFCQ